LLAIVVGNSIASREIESLESEFELPSSCRIKQKSNSARGLVKLREKDVILFKGSKDRTWESRRGSFSELLIIVGSGRQPFMPRKERYLRNTLVQWNFYPENARIPSPNRCAICQLFNTDVLGQSQPAAIKYRSSPSLVTFLILYIARKMRMEYGAHWTAHWQKNTMYSEPFRSDGFANRSFAVNAPIA
jgi:hypothetical protein